MANDTRYFVADLVEEVGSMPALAAQIVSMTSDPECDTGDLARVILCDNVMTMRFLALVNSAALSGGGEVRDLRRALIRLGLRRVRNVALCMGMHDMMPCRPSACLLQMDDFWKYSLATASCAEGLAWLQGAAAQEDAWLAGILHGIGVAAMEQKMTADFSRAVERATADGIALADAELAVLDFHHGELGGRILGQWKLPRVFIEAVEYCPESYAAGEVSEEADQLIGYLRSAIEIVRCIGFGNNGDGTAPAALPDLVDRLQIDDSLLTALADKVDRDVAWMSQLIGLDIPEHAFKQVLEESKRKMARVGLEGIDESLAREDLEQQLDMARDIQRRLLPEQTPEVPSGTIAAVNHPSCHVSGDYYDFLRAPDGSMGLVVADVSGKGMCASLLASNLQASLRALIGVIDDPGQLLATVNDALFETTAPERFATLFLGILAPDGRSLRYASAGHNPPLIAHADGTETWLASAGTPLGMVPGMQYPVGDIDLASGDLLVIYTDGVVEAADAGGEEFGEEGLSASVRRDPDQRPAAVITRLLADILCHTTPQARQGACEDARAAARVLPTLDLACDTFADDLTLVVMKVDD